MFFNNNPNKETKLYNAFKDNFKNKENVEFYFNNIFDSMNFSPYHDTVFMVETPDMD